MNPIVNFLDGLISSSHRSALDWGPILRLGWLSSLYAATIKVLSAKKHNASVIYGIKLFLGQRCRHLLREALGEIVYV